MLLDRFYGDYRAAEAADNHRNSRPSTISRFLLLGNITTLLCAKNRRVTSTLVQRYPRKPQSSENRTRKPQCGFPKNRNAVFRQSPKNRNAVFRQSPKNRNAVFRQSPSFALGRARTGI